MPILGRESALMILEIVIFSFKNRLNFDFYPQKYVKFFLGGRPLICITAMTPKKSERSKKH